MEISDVRLPPKADMLSVSIDVRLVSLADIGMKVCSSTKHGKTLDKPHGSH